MKKIPLILCVILIVSCFAGCGGRMSDNKQSAPMEPAAAYGGYSGSEYDYGEAADGDYYYAKESGEGEMLPPVSGSPAANADAMDKIIYSVSAEIETLEFDKSVEDVYRLVTLYSGFIESSSITGTDYYTSFYSSKSYREASFTIRVPRENYKSVYGGLSGLGNVTYAYENAENITMRYNDTESRLKTYRTEEERLLAMLEKAENVEDMIMVEERLGEVRYNIESVTSQLLNWDSKINYSTVSIHLREVNELTRETVISKTFGQEVAEGLTDSLEWLGDACKNIVVFIVSALPVLVLPAAIAVIVILIVRRHSKKKKAKKAAEQEAKQ